MQIKLPEAILSYPSLGKPAKDNFDAEKAPRFKCDLIFPKGTDLTELNEAIAKHIADDFKGKEPKNMPLKLAETQIDKETGLVKSLYDQGDYFIKPWSGEGDPPALISPQNKPGYAPQNFKGGNLVNVIVNTWAMTTFSGTIGLGLMAVQWVREGKQVGSTVNLNLFSEVPAEPINFQP